MDLQLPTTVLPNLKDIHWNLSAAELYEEIVRKQEGRVAHQGPIVAYTGEYTGRSPKDKYIVVDETTDEQIWWDGGEAHKFTDEQYEALRMRQEAYLQGRSVYVQDCYAGADDTHRLPVRIVTQKAWHNLFARNMFIQEADEANLADFAPEFTVIHTPGFKANPERDGTRSEVFVVLNFAKRTVLIGGSEYAGEIKKSIFTTLNYLLPLKGVLGMHCSANIGSDGDSALFFGLSGTGKTTLSTDPERQLIGDDEHGWSDEGIFNFEGGCYAKVINLSPAAEPQIFATTKMFGTILENVAFHEGSRHLNLDDASFTENTRASYPIDSIPNVVESGRGAHPKNVILLTCDAFGVMPPIARLTPEQAMYHFISGYTAKVAGTERGITEPRAAFSACFGAPFMPLHPGVYAKLLGEHTATHGSTCWLVNTGWTGGPYGAGTRMAIQHSRALLRAALSGDLEGVEMRTDPVFGFSVPMSCPGVPDSILDPRSTWTDKAGYDTKAAALAEMFQTNFERFAEGTSADISAAGPRVAQPS
ncbi:MAG: phosphoenolpyruvate carboxykinase [Planctomycetota bacterium]|nr:phosphoenolpyruvate carboxykinase [Planctomycetota bacterium]